LIKLIYQISIVFFLIIISCDKEKKQEPNDKSKLGTSSPSVSSTNTPVDKFKISKIKNVCDCYSFSVDIYNQAISIRMSYNDFEDFSKNQTSVNKVKQLMANWREIRAHCIMTYQRAMFEPNNCKYPSDSVEKLKNKFYSLGFTPSY
tara:strand:+ start:58 stop:498 length:441 start_codon:yes stop_codon:yes gene_type:complete